MPTPQRLPIVNSDDAVWGDILRQFLMKEHFNDDTNNAANGGHQTITVKAGTTAAGTAPVKLTSGALMTAAEVGALEFLTDALYFTVSTGTTRKKVALYDDASGATGDIYYRNSSGIFTRLAVGADGKVLKVTSGLPAWGDASTAATATKTSNYTIVSGTDVVILANAASGAVTITLPTAASSAGYKFDIKRIDSTGNTCTIARSGSDTIDGGTSLTLDVQYISATVVSDGSAWYII
ncbi:MAG: hypothetical protein ABIR37_01130 [Candidatus Saccharimonadales bacterium]